jgi:hypothetical protein
MAVPRPVLLAILGLALCVTALIAVRGLGGEDDAIAPAPIPTTPQAAEKGEPAQPGARGRGRARPNAQGATPAKPAEPTQGSAKVESQPKAEDGAKGGQKLSQSAIDKLKDKAQLASVATALEQDDVVVLLFSRPGAADDTGVRSAVKALDDVKGVQVFKPRFEDLDNYRPVLAGVGVSQVPAIVITRPGKKAQLIEGYVDRKSLRQQVEDARR